MQYPIYDLFSVVGMVTVQQSGLYCVLRAIIEVNKSGFVRLYYHREGQTYKIGIFRMEDGKYSCDGKISLRQIGNLEGGEFSLCEMQWCREHDYIYRDCDWGREVLLPLEGGIPQRIMPYFCFLQRSLVNEIPCLSLKLDKQGMPFL